MSAPAKERTVADLRDTADNLHADLNALADEIESGEADRELVARTMCALGHAHIHIEDAGHEFGVVDAESPEFRAVNQSRIAMFAAANAIALAPKTGSRWSQALEANQKAIEYIEQAQADREKAATAGD